MGGGRAGKQRCASREGSGRWANLPLRRYDAAAARLSLPSGLFIVREANKQNASDETIREIAVLLPKLDRHGDTVPHVPLIPSDTLLADYRKVWSACVFGVQISTAWHIALVWQDWCGACACACKCAKSCVFLCLCVSTSLLFWRSACLFVTAVCFVW